jgi:hypothetical protein
VVTTVRIGLRNANATNTTFNNAQGNAVSAKTVSEGPFIATWESTTAGTAAPTAAVVGGIEPGGIVAVVTGSVLSDGNPGPSWTPGAVTSGDFFLRLDNKGPTLADLDNALRASRWINESWDFTGTTAAPAVATDDGVGALSGLTWEFSVGPNPADVEVIESAEDLDESATANTYVLRIRAMDQLGNTTTRWFDGTPAGAADNAAGRTAASTTGRFGVDNTPPVIAFAAGSSANQRATTGMLTYNISVTDPVNSAGGASGFEAEPLQARSIRTHQTLGACAIGSGSACNFTGINTLSPTIGVGGAFAATEGYFDTSFRVFDRAGNASEVISRTGLSDETAPVLGSVAVPGGLTGGAVASFSVSATDNLNLGTADIFNVFGGVATIQFEARQTLGTFGTPLDEISATVTASTPFVRGVQATDVGNNPIGAFQVPTAVRFDVRDLPPNPLVAATGPIAFTRPATAPASFPASWAFAATRSPATGDICLPTPDTACPTGSISSINVQATLSGDLGTTPELTNPPFQAVVLAYRVALSTDDWRFVGSSATASATGTAPARTWTYGAITFAPTAAQLNLAAGGTVDIELVSIGRNADGDALIGQPVTVTVERTTP